MDSDLNVLKMMVERCNVEEGKLKEKLTFVRQKRRQIEKTIHLVGQMTLPLEAGNAVRVPGDPKKDGQRN